MSIYIPDDLKERMDQLGENTVNWSNTAQAAFRQAIVNSTFREDFTMEDVIERLRASKAAEDQQDRAEGVKDGRRWASVQASYRELWSVASEDFSSAFDGDYAAVLIEKLGEGNEDFFDGEPRSDAYVEGFVQGAGEIWEAVRGKV